MVSGKMKPLVENNSVIRVMFEEGKRLSSIYGPENVFDFSLGNPNVPAPDEVKESILEIIQEEDSAFIHGYMSYAGYEDVRETIAHSLNERFGTDFGVNNILMTVGAASGLNVILKTILEPGDEVIVFAPYFVEYGNYVANYDGRLVTVSPNTVDFQPNLEELKQKITEKTKAVIINTPNNPTGVVYSEDTLKKLAEILENKEKEFKREIVLLSDEPYRELAYDGVQVPYVTKYYKNTVVCYSYSKSLSLPGERIGYLVIPNELRDSQETFTAASIANRVLGCVNAPSLMQRVIKRCIEKGASVNLMAYDRNRNRLYEGLKECGFSCIRPDGAFYLFVKSPVEDEKEFCSRAAKHNLLLVPGSSFACPGYVRIAYCVSYEKIEGSMPAFRALAEEYGLQPV